MGLREIFVENKLPKFLVLALSLYFVFLLVLARDMRKIVDEGTHSLLGVFYSDLARFSLSNPSFSKIYNYSYSYLIDFPKLSVYYPPLTHLMVAVLFFVFGKSMFVARLVPIILSIAFAALTYNFSFYLTKKKDVSVLATFIYMSSPVVLFLSSSLLLEVAMSMFFTLGVFLFLIGMKSKKYRHFALAGIAAALGFFSKWQAALVIPMVFLYLILFERKGLMKNLKNFLVFLIVFSIVIAPYVLIMIRLDLFFVTFTSPVGAIGGYGDRPQFWNIESWLFYPISVFTQYFVLPLAVMTLLGLYYCVKESFSGNGDGKNYFRLLLVWLAVIYIFFSLLPNRQERFILPVVFPLSLLTALTSDIMIKKFGKIGKLVLMLLISFNFVMSMFIPVGGLSISERLVQTTVDEKIGDFLISNPQAYYLASESPYLSPSNIMSYLAGNGARIKGVRTCALTEINETDWDAALQEYGVRWVFYDLGNMNQTERPDTRFVIDALAEDGLIRKVDAIENIEVYEFLNYNETPERNCNYICLIQEKICE